MDWLKEDLISNMADKEEQGHEKNLSTKMSNSDATIIIISFLKPQSQQTKRPKTSQNYVTVLGDKQNHHLITKLTK